MRELFLRIRLPLLFAALVLLTLASIVSDRRALDTGGTDHGWFGSAVFEIVAPVQKALAWPASALRQGFRSYVDLVDVNQENEQLRLRVAELEEANLQYQEALVQSGHLERIVRMRERFEVPLLPAEVVGYDASPWFRSVLVDRGRSDRVHSGMPVVTEHGLVGLVTATSPQAARAMLLIDRQSAVDGIVQRSRARGIVRGDGRGGLEFVFMIRGDDVADGDVVLTSGVGGVHPKGIRVGRVRNVQTDEASLLHTAVLEPAVDFGRLEQVFVMLRRGPTMELLYGGEGDAPAGPEGEAPEEAAAPEEAP